MEPVYTGVHHNPVLELPLFQDIGWTLSSPTTPATATHDFNADGKSDIAWRDTSGDAAVWLMNGAQVIQSAGVATVPTAWTVVGTEDFNGDGKSDILWRDTSGDVAIWLMNGAQLIQSSGVATVPTTWTIVETGDFDGD